MEKLSFLVFGLTVLCVRCASVGSDSDSYLDALRRSQAAEANDRTARDDYSSGGFSDNSIGLTSGYDYTPKHNEYGPPSTGYGSPAPYPPTSYGSYPSGPAPVYGPPKPINMYNYAGPPHAYNLPGEHWLLDKLKFKLDLFTIGKILIKLIIFKKIIKFIALICLLLWLPKFQSKHMKMEDEDEDEVEDDDDDDDDRRRALNRDYYPSTRRLNEIAQFTYAAMNAFKAKQLKDCEKTNELYCRFNSMVDTIDTEYPYSRIVKLYLTDNSNPFSGQNQQSQVNTTENEISAVVNQSTKSPTTTETPINSTIVDDINSSDSNNVTTKSA